MKKFYTKKHLSLDIAEKENWQKFNHKQERTYRNVDDNWQSKLTKLSSEQKSKLLFKYAYEGNLKMVKAITNSEGEVCNVDYLDKDNNLALMYAIKGGKKAIVEYLAKRTSNIDCLNLKGFSPLHLAVRKNRLDLVAVLVDNGANINIKDKDGRIVLFDAVAENNTQMINALILNGCDKDSCDKNRITPLMYAIEATHRQIAMCELIRLGANVNYQDAYWGKNALMHAIKCDNRAAMDILMKNGADIFAKDKNGRTALMYCAKMGNREGIRVLISKGVDIFAKDIEGKTAQDIALYNCAHGSAQILAKAEKIYKSNLSEEQKKQQLKIFAKHNKVENSCAK